MRITVLLQTALLLMLVPISAGASVAEGTTRTIEIKLEGGTPLAVDVFVPDFDKLIDQTLPTLPAQNAEVLKSLRTFPTDGTHTYFWPRSGESSYDGVTTDVVVNGLTVLRGEEKGRAFCCGLTLQVAYDVLQRSAVKDRLPRDKSVYDQFKKLWFCEKLFSPGPTDALLWAKLGTKIEPDDALMGDFLQIWRHNKSGHSVVFIAWAYDAQGQRAGIHYWSTQTSTQGIGFNTELLGPSGSAIDLSRSGFSRLNPVID